jgi:hypothetical protein
VAKRKFHFLKVELESIKAGDAIKILLEQTFERILNHPTLPFPLIKGM